MGRGVGGGQGVSNAGPKRQASPCMPLLPILFPWTQLPAAQSPLAGASLSTGLPTANTPTPDLQGQKAAPRPLPPSPLQVIPSRRVGAVQPGCPGHPSQFPHPLFQGCPSPLACGWQGWVISNCPPSSQAAVLIRDYQTYLFIIIGLG